MKHLQYVVLLLAVLSAAAFGQSRDYRTHKRGLLHQTIYNTGEIGRALEARASTQVGLPQGTSSWEWPPNSYQILNQVVYWGNQNSFGGGILFGATVNGAQVYKACGGLGDGAGNATTIAGVYCNPGPIDTFYNFPVTSDGRPNTAFNPNEAEEKIVTSYTTTDPMKLLVTQTSRAWSYPGYDAFIIVEYDILNTDTTDYTNGFVLFMNGLVPNAFGMQRKYGLWDESSNTTRSKECYDRYNFTRYLTYVHTRDGFPDPQYFAAWSTEGNRGGLNSASVPGFMVLHYDTLHLQLRSQTGALPATNTPVWDANNRIIQPYNSQVVPNRNIDQSRAETYGLNLSTRTYASFAQGDSANWARYYAPSYADDPATNNALWRYWLGRAKPRALTAGNYTQTSMHYVSFGPYVFKKGEHLKFAVAHLVGYGPGEAQDTVLRDGGGWASEPAGYVTGGCKPVVSWHDSITYPGISSIAPNSMGNNYLKTHPLPWYVAGRLSARDTMPVISLRSVADRAIQMYTGNPYKNYDREQFKPELTPPTGSYNSANISMPYPAPVFRVENTGAAVNKLIWGTAAESFTSPGLPPFSHYLAYRSQSGLGPWALMDSIGKSDPRYFQDSVYTFYDRLSNLGEDVYYLVYSVDSLGGRSGKTNITLHTTQAPAATHLEKVWVVPNPLIVTNGVVGQTSLGGNAGDQIRIMGLTRSCTIRIFSYSGQLVATIEHNSTTDTGYSDEWFQISRNNQLIGSGVYFLTVEDHTEGRFATGKFVVIH